MLTKEYEKGNSCVSGEYKWLAWDDNDQQCDPSRRRLSTHPVNTWRCMESRLYSMSKIHGKSDGYISKHLDLSPTDFLELRKINGKGRLPGEDTIPRNARALVYLPCV